MFDLERTEKRIVLFLTATLLLGLGVAFYARSRPVAQVKVEHFTVDRPARDAGRQRSFERNRIDINEAGVEELMSLKGVGKVLAARIIDYRSSHGRFVTTDDIRKVGGVGPALFEKIRDDIAVE